MIRFTKNEEGFNIIYKDFNFFSHSNSIPIFEIGIGIGKFRQSHSSFRIDEKIEKRIPLKEFELLNELEHQLIIEFNNKEYVLVVEFFIKNDKLIITPKCDHPEINRLWMRIVANKKEAIFGCGEQFRAINLRNNSIPIWVEDASPLSRKDHTYYPQPNFISSSKYFFHADTQYYSNFNFKDTEYHEIYFWSIPNEIFIGKYETLIHATSELNKHLGIQPKLPDWVFDGIWLGIQGGSEIINKKIDKTLAYGIKVTAVWCQDWQGIRYTSFGKQLFWDWKYDEKIYPKLPEYIHNLKSRGIRFLGYINTMIAIEGNLYKEASKMGYCLKDKDGKDYYTTMTDFPAAQIDFSNPDAVEWIKNVIKNNMIGIGLNGWMIDYGEYVPADSYPYSGISGEEFHNISPTLWTKLNFEALKETNNLGKLIFFVRAGYTGTSRYSIIQFSGDQRVDWDEWLGLPSVIPAAINMGLCGIGYYQFDIGCYTTYGEFKRTKELFMRSAEIATFSMVMRTHEGNRPNDNWQFDSDAETLEHLAKMVNIHVDLKPYLQHLSEEYQLTGISPIRGCFMHYEDDPELYNLKFQYLLGRDLLIAPVIKPNLEIWRVYLPEDNWIHLWTENEYKKGWIEVKAPKGMPPVFYRKDSKFMPIFKKLKKIQ